MYMYLHKINDQFGDNRLPPFMQSTWLPFDSSKLLCCSLTGISPNFISIGNELSTVKLRKPMDTRNVFGMFIVFRKKTNQIHVREEKIKAVMVICSCGLILSLVGHGTINIPEKIK